MRIWILSTCIPDECKPCWPDAFASEAEARAAFERMMREEWEHNAPTGDDDEPLPFPEGQPEEANRLMADAGDGWGEWLLSCHEIPAPTAATAGA